MKKLNLIQTEIKAPKNMYNSFGKYKFRNVEGILTSVKPYLKEHNATLLLNDEIVMIGDRYYVKATVTFIDNETSEEQSVSAFAREVQDKKGMDGSQITGSASSYARKYALNGLFLLDDTKDADATNKHGKENAGVTNKEKIVNAINGTSFTGEDVAVLIKALFGKQLQANELTDEQISKLLEEIANQTM